MLRSVVFTDQFSWCFFLGEFACATPIPTLNHSSCAGAPTAMATRAPTTAGPTATTTAANRHRELSPHLATPLVPKLWNKRCLSYNIQMNKIHLLKKKGSPIYMRFVFDAGSRHDTKPGLAHFVEHMLVAGTKKFPTKDTLARYIEITGGSFSASTDQDFLRLNFEIAEQNDLDIIVQLVDEIFNHSLFNEKTIENERGAIITELQKNKSNPGSYIWNLFKKISFQNTPLSHSTLGDIDSINSITREDLLQFKEKYIRFDNASLIVAGDIDENLLKKKLGIESSIKETERSSTKISQEPLPISYDQKILIEHADIEQTYFVFGTRIKPLSVSERAVLNLALTYLTSGRSGKLVEELRYRRGFIYNIIGDLNARNDWATWSISSSVNPKNINETISVIVEEIKQLQQNPFSLETLEYMKSKIVKSYIIKLQSSKAVVESNESGLLATEPYNIDEFIEATKRLTAEDIMKVFSKLVDVNKFFLSVYGPTPKADIGFSQSLSV